MRRADVCAVALAELFRGDGEILANPIGNLPMIGGRLARETFEPDLVMTDGEACLVANAMPVGTDNAHRVIEAWNPYRSMFDIVWSGRRHIIMGPVQLDRHGNANIAWLGDDQQRPKVQLLGFRGGPGNTISHGTSYWVPNHSPRVFVDTVDVVSCLGYDRAAALNPASAKDHRIPGVVTNLGVIDFEGPDHAPRLRSVHPGVTVDEVVEATGFELLTDDVAETRLPTDEDLAIIEDVDPTGLRYQEVPDP